MISSRGAKLAYITRRLAAKPRSDQPVAVAMSRRWIVPEVAPLFADPWSGDNMRDAVHERLASKLPVPTIRHFYRLLRSYARIYFRKHFESVPLDSYLAKGDLFEWWISPDRSTYPAKRREFLRNLWNVVRGRVLQVRDFRCKAFVKTESYEEPKWPRAIVSRSDPYKCFSGPWFALIEEQAYQCPFFIKHVPVSDRAQFVSRLEQHGLPILASDFSSFELHANAHVQRAVELQFYKYMLRDIPDASEFLKTHAKVATRTQVLSSRDWQFRLPACRMSGETCTSLGNGITNLVLVNFITEHFGGHVRDAVVEGDDGLYAIQGHVPTAADFSAAGCKAVLQRHDDLSHAGFCSMYFVDVGGRRIMMRDFREKLVRFGWTCSKLRYARPDVIHALLRGAAFALACELGSCPVLWMVAQCVLNETTGPMIIDEDGYHRVDTSRSIAVHEPPELARSAYAELFGVDIPTQRALENEIRGCGLNGPLVREMCWTSARAQMWELVAVRRAGTPVVFANDRP